MSLCRKLTAVITTLCFLFSFICAPVLQASLGDAHANRTPGSGQDTDQFLISPGIGSITASKDFKSELSVITIQDLHCNPEVQKNIMKIIGALDDKYNLKKVYVEGGYGEVDTSWLEGLPDANLKKKIAEVLVDSGRLTGSEYYSIITGKPHLLKGLEDEKLHKENVIRLGKILGQNKSFEETAKKLDNDIALLKARYLNRKNYKLNALIKDYRDHTISAQKYYLLLQRYVDEINNHPDKYNALYNIRMSNYPSTTAYLDLLDLDTHLNSPRITRQLQNLIQELRAILPYREYNTLLRQTDNFRKTDTLYELLAQIVKEQRIDISRHYPDLDHFFTYLAKRKSVNPVLLIKEEKRLIEELRIALSSDVSEVEISFLADFYDTFKDYLFNKLSANDYEYFVSRFDKFKTIWAKYTYTNHLKELEPEFATLDEYYRTNNERTDRFVENVLNDKSSKIIVMVTGGFHSEGLQKLLEERRVSYLTITPNVVHDTAGSTDVYQGIIKDQADVYSRQALSNTISSSMRPEFRGTATGFIIRFMTGEYISVEGVKAEGHITIKMTKSGEKAFNAANAPPDHIQGLMAGINLGVRMAPEVVEWQMKAIKDLVGLVDLVPGTYHAFIMMSYFLARKGWITDKGLTWEIAHIDSNEKNTQAQEYLLSVLADELGEKISLNELEGFPPSVQRAIRHHVKRIKTYSHQIPASKNWIKPVNTLYRLIIALNSNLDPEAIQSPGEGVMADTDNEYSELHTVITNAVPSSYARAVVEDSLRNWLLYTDSKESAEAFYKNIASQISQTDATFDMAELMYDLNMVKKYLAPEVRKKHEAEVKKLHEGAPENGAYPRIRVVTGFEFTKGQIDRVYEAFTSELPKDEKEWRVHIAVVPTMKGQPFRNCNHAKMVLRDGASGGTLITGGHQFWNLYSNAIDLWSDLSVKLRGLIVKKSQKDFDRIYNSGSSSFFMKNARCSWGTWRDCWNLPPVPQIPEKTYPGAKEVDAYSLIRGRFDSSDVDYSADEALYALIGAAKDHIYISQHRIEWFTYYDPVVIAKIFERASNGVPVDILISNINTKDINRIRLAGVQWMQSIGINDPRKMQVILDRIHFAITTHVNHNKFISIDGKAFYVGAQNLFPGAIGKNIAGLFELIEYGVVFLGRVAESVEEFFQEVLWSEAGKIESSDLLSAADLITASAINKNPFANRRLEDLRTRRLPMLEENWFKRLIKKKPAVQNKIETSAEHINEKPGKSSTNESDENGDIFKRVAEVLDFENPVIACDLDVFTGKSIGQDFIKELADYLRNGGAFIFDTADTYGRFRKRILAALEKELSANERDLLERMPLILGDGKELYIYENGKYRPIFSVKESKLDLLPPLKIIRWIRGNIKFTDAQLEKGLGLKKLLELWQPSGRSFEMRKVVFFGIFGGKAFMVLFGKKRDMAVVRDLRGDDRIGLGVNVGQKIVGLPDNFVNMPYTDPGVTINMLRMVNAEMHRRISTITERSNGTQNTKTLSGKRPDKPSSHYSEVPKEMPPGAQYPTQTILHPIAGESWSIISKKLVKSMAARDRYNAIAGPNKANILICDDGLMKLADGAGLTLLANSDPDGLVRQLQEKKQSGLGLTDDEQELLSRMEFYLQHGLAVVARPPDGSSFENWIFKRLGAFKKGSNMNHSLSLGKLVSQGVSEGLTLGEAVQQSRGTLVKGSPIYSQTMVLGDIRPGELLMLLDKDSGIPVNALVKVAPEFVIDPTLAYTQNYTTIANRENSWLTRLLAANLELLMLKVYPKIGASRGLIPFRGHNGVVRLKALDAIGGWSEKYVAEDIAMALWMNDQKEPESGKRYHGLYVHFSHPEFSELLAKKDLMLLAANKGITEEAIRRLSEEGVEAIVERASEGGIASKTVRQPQGKGYSLEQLAAALLLYEEESLDFTELAPENMERLFRAGFAQEQLVINPVSLWSHKGFLSEFIKKAFRSPAVGRKNGLFLGIGISLGLLTPVIIGAASYLSLITLITGMTIPSLAIASILPLVIFSGVRAVSFKNMKKGEAITLAFVAFAYLSAVLPHNSVGTIRYLANRKSVYGATLVGSSKGTRYGEIENIVSHLRTTMVLILMFFSVAVVTILLSPHFLWGPLTIIIISFWTWQGVMGLIGPFLFSPALWHRAHDSHETPSGKESEALKVENDELIQPKEDVEFTPELERLGKWDNWTEVKGKARAQIKPGERLMLHIGGSGTGSKSYVSMAKKIIDLFGDLGFPKRNRAYFSFKGPGKISRAKDSYYYSYFETALRQYLDLVPDENILDIYALCGSGKFLMSFISDEKNEKWVRKMNVKDEKGIAITRSSAIKGVGLPGISWFFYRVSISRLFKLIDSLFKNKITAIAISKNWAFLLLLKATDTFFPFVRPRSDVSMKLAHPEQYWNLYRPPVSIINIVGKDFQIGPIYYQYHSQADIVFNVHRRSIAHVPELIEPGTTAFLKGIYDGSFPVSATGRSAPLFLSNKDFLNMTPEITTTDESVPRNSARLLIILESTLNDPDLRVRQTTASALGAIYAELYRHGSMSLTEIESKLNDPHWVVRNMASSVLGQIYLDQIKSGKSVNVSLLESRQTDEIRRVRNTAAKALLPIYHELARQGRLKRGQARGLPEASARAPIYEELFWQDRILLSLLKSKLIALIWAIRKISLAVPSSAKYVEQFKQGKMSLSTLESLLNDQDSRVRRAASSAFGQILQAHVTEINDNDFKKYRLWSDLGFSFQKNIVERYFSDEVDPQEFVEKAKVKMKEILLKGFDTNNEEECWYAFQCIRGASKHYAGDELLTFEDFLEKLNKHNNKALPDQPHIEGFSFGVSSFSKKPETIKLPLVTIHLEKVNPGVLRPIIENLEARAMTRSGDFFDHLLFSIARGGLSKYGEYIKKIGVKLVNPDGKPNVGLAYLREACEDNTLFIRFLEKLIVFLCEKRDEARQNSTVKSFLQQLVELVLLESNDTLGEAINNYDSEKASPEKISAILRELLKFYTEAYPRKIKELLEQEGSYLAGDWERKKGLFAADKKTIGALEREYGKIEEEEISTVELEFVPSKQKLDVFYGNVSKDSLDTDDEAFYENDFYLYRIQIKGNPVILGYVYIAERELDGEKVWLLAGIQPGRQLSFDVHSFLNKLFKNLSEVAAREGVSMLLLDQDEHFTSSRESIRKAIRVLISRNEMEPITVNTNLVFPHHPKLKHHMIDTDKFFKIWQAQSQNKESHLSNEMDGSVTNSQDEHTKNTMSFLATEPKSMPAGKEFPTWTIVLPIVTESWTVIKRTLTDSLAACERYNEVAHGKKATILVCDDGLMRLAQDAGLIMLANDPDGVMRLLREKKQSGLGLTDNEQDILSRMEFYTEHDLAVVARPDHNSVFGWGIFKRLGMYPKGSNMNHALSLSKLVSQAMAGGLGLTQAIERAKETRVDGKPVYSGTFVRGDIRYGDLFMQLDKDSTVPVRAMVAIAPEFVIDPALAYAQCYTVISNREDSATASLIARDFELMEEEANPANAAAGGMVMFFGHNGIIRSAALEMAGNWSEEVLGEDINMTLRLNRLRVPGTNTPYHGLFVKYSHPSYSDLLPRDDNERVEQKVPMPALDDESVDKLSATGLEAMIERARYRGIAGTEIRAAHDDGHSLTEIARALLAYEELSLDFTELVPVDFVTNARMTYRLSFAIVQLLLNPMTLWLRQGIVSDNFKSFWRESSFPRHYKLRMLNMLLPFALQLSAGAAMFLSLGSVVFASVPGMPSLVGLGIPAMTQSLISLTVLASFLTSVVLMSLRARKPGEPALRSFVVKFVFYSAHLPHLVLGPLRYLANRQTVYGATPVNIAGKGRFNEIRRITSQLRSMLSLFVAYVAIATIFLTLPQFSLNAQMVAMLGVGLWISAAGLLAPFLFHPTLWNKQPALKNNGNTIDVAGDSPKMLVRFDHGAGLPMVPIISGNNEKALAYASVALNKGAVPIIVQPLTDAAENKNLRSGAAKDVWVDVENDILNVYIEAVSDEDFRKKAIDYIITLKGYANMQGSMRQENALEEAGGKKLDTRRMEVVDGIGLRLPALFNIPILSEDGSFVPWDVADSVRYGETAAAASEIGFLVTEWKDQFKTIPRINRSLLFTQEALLAAGKDNIRTLRIKGAKIYVLYNGTDKDGAITLAENFEINGIIFPNAGESVMREITGAMDHIKATTGREVIVAGSNAPENVRGYQEITLGATGFRQEIERIRTSMKLGPIVHVKFGENFQEEDFLALSGLPVSTILMFDREEFMMETLRRDITTLMFFGVNLLDQLHLTPTPQEEQAYERRVAYLLEIDNFEKYDSEASLDEEFERVTTAKGEITFSKNQKLFEAVRYRAQERISDPVRRAAFLNAVKERLWGLSVAGKHGNIDNVELEMILGSMAAKHSAYTQQRQPYDQTVIDRFKKRKKEAGVTTARFQFELYSEIKTLEWISLNGDAQKQPLAVNTIIELIRLYAGERILTPVTSEDFIQVRVDATKAILQAG